MTYEPEHLERWTLPDNYAGEVWPNYYVFLGRHRDSDLLAISNFERGLDLIGGEDGDLVVVVREGHWAVGWVEWIGIHQDAEAALKVADEIKASLADYPVVDDEDLSAREAEAAIEYWNGWSATTVDLRHRLDVIKTWNERHSGPQWFDARVPILAARHDLGELCDRYPEFGQRVEEIGRGL